MTSPPHAHFQYSRSHRAVEVVCIAAVFAMLAGFCVHVTRTIDSPAGWVNLALTGLTAYVATDAMSGVVHWAGDTIGHDKIWFVGPSFIRPFREHHFDQKAITRHDFIETNGNNCILIAGPLILAFLLSPARESFGFFVTTFVAFMALFVLATNQFHKWAHADHPPAMARQLQRWGLILSPRHHEIHHAVPHDKHYCITVGWMNPLLNGARFFRAAEWMIARVRPRWLYIEERGFRTLPGAATGVAAVAGGGLKSTAQNPAAPSSGLPAPTP